MAILGKVPASIIEVSIPYSSSSTEGTLARLLGRTGLPQMRFHGLRRTCATPLLTPNVHPKHVQELLGYATVAIVLDTYSHVILGMGNHTSCAMEGVFP